MWKRKTRRRRGQALVEYILLVGLLGFGVFGAVKLGLNTVRQSTQKMADRLNGVTEQMDAPAGWATEPDGSSGSSTGDASDASTPHPEGEHTYMNGNDGAFCVGCGEAKRG